MTCEDRLRLLEMCEALISKHATVPPEVTHYEGAVLIPPELQRDVAETASRLLENWPALEERFALEDLSDRIKGVVVETVRAGLKYLPALVAKLADRLENRDEWKRCYVPLIGMRLSQPLLEIGPLRLRLMDSDALAELKALSDAAVDRTTNTLAEKTMAKEQWTKWTADDLRGSVCLEVQVLGDTHKAEQAGMDRAHVLLDLLRYSIPAIYLKRRNTQVGFRGEGRPGIFTRYVLPVGASDARLNRFMEHTSDLDLDKQTLAIMAELGVLKIAAAVERSQTGFEEAVFRAIHWFAESQVQRAAAYELVSLLVALESVIAIPGQDSSGTNLICEVAAVMLEDDPDQRERTFDFMRRVHRQRGDVVHQGVHDASGDDLPTLRLKVQAIISKAISFTGRFKTTAELREWVAGQKSGLMVRKPQTPAQRRR